MHFKVVKNTVLFSLIIGILFIPFSCGNRVTEETGSSKQEVVETNSISMNNSADKITVETTHSIEEISNDTILANGKTEKPIKFIE